MDRWAGRTALVTGASAGIGRAIASRLAQQGLVVIACARNLQRLQELKEAHSGDKGTIVPIQCDLRKEEEILSMFERIKREVGGVDVCVNNAGIARIMSLLSESTEHWRAMLEVNVLALSVCTREAVKSMRERGIDDGFIVNIGSIGGRQYSPENGVAFYAGTKYAVATLSKALTTELQATKSRIRVMEISPGLVETEMAALAAGKAFADRLFSSVEALSAEDIADCVVFALSAPSRARVSEIIIEPVEEIDFKKLI